MFKTVPPIVSYAHRELITLLEKRKFTHTLSKEYNMKKSVVAHVHFVSIYKQRPSYGVIYLLREYIEPIKWFYDENETLPEPTAFIPKYKEYTAETSDTFAKMKTLAHVYVSYLQDTRMLKSFCSKFGITPMNFGNYIYYKKRKSGEMGYGARPSYDLAKKLRNAIKPDYWYIFPDEVDTIDNIREEALSFISKNLL